MINRFIQELKQNRNLFCFAKILFLILLRINYYNNKIIKENIKNIKLIEIFLSKTNIQMFKNYIISGKEKLLIFYKDISLEDINFLKNHCTRLFNPKNFNFSSIHKNIKDFEEIINFFRILNKYIIFEKLKNPNNYINVNEIIKDYNKVNKNLNSKDSGVFILSLLSKYYAKKGIEINITKVKDRRLKDINIDLASIQYLFSFGEMKKYVLHFDFGEKSNQEILNNEEIKNNFIVKMKNKIISILKIDINNIILTNIHYGCVTIDCIFLNQKIIYEKLKEKLNNESMQIKNIEEKPLIESLQISLNILDPMGDRPEGFWTLGSQGNTIGGKAYITPLDGWSGLGLNVAYKYDSGNNNWLGYENQTGEFVIAYMGINKIFGDNNLIINNDSVFLFQNPKKAENNSAIINMIGYQIKILFMCRVNPRKIRELRNYPDNWILSPTSDEIRPYRILVKKIFIPKEPTIIISFIPIRYIKEAINSNDYSFYEKSGLEEFKKFSEINSIKLPNDLFVIRLYSSVSPCYYKYLNDYLRHHKIERFLLKEMNSWACCLYSALKKRKNVNNGDIVYRGVPIKFPSEIKIGSIFFFREFLSTTCAKDVSEIYAGNGTLFIIKIENNGINNSPIYCFNCKGISMIEDEEEILISCHCYFRLTKIHSSKTSYDVISLTCLGPKNDSTNFIYCND